MILCQLARGERSVGEIAAHLTLSQSALSQHLARLRRDGIVATRRQSQTIMYRIAGPEPARIMEALYRLYCAPKTKDR
jgi:ArsR family transcriptional regulator, virulence genes transcriptional regulator